MISDEIKLSSDDSFFTEAHIIFLINKYRALILTKSYKDVKKIISESNYQTIKLDLEIVNTIENEPCIGETYLRSKEEIPVVLPIGSVQVYPINYFSGNIVYTTREKMRYVGFNKYMKNIIYASIGPDMHLYFKSNNPQHKYLEQVKMTGVFEDCVKASDLSCDCKDKEEVCDIYDKTVALEESLVPLVIESVVKELLGAAYRPNDNTNNANDDLSDLVSFIRRNTKNNLQKQIEGE